ncbi:ABC transporter ATP-binding protein [Ornithinibacillus californiensis]|uniref:ABC transporter ATP-binding protein n=1 Tax=Ornithinibacillus californiensis TaxID=161536 RepID=UPI00064DD775|nr:ABC transporter ATP-binding protein [Ornithinibacillus californiensis]
MQAVIQTESLSKSYKGFHALDKVSLQVNKGEIYGFIGLNGAGKTTMIRMLLGMIKPSEGACFINGKRVSLHNYSIWKDVGYMVETPYAYPELTVKENLDISRRLHSIRDPLVVTTIMEKLNLTRYADKRAKNLSLGNAQRLGIAKALLHNPKILILDEPVNGLDPAGIVEVRELLMDLATNHGVTVFISSHLLSEVAKISTKIGIIHEGKLQQEISSPELNQLLTRKLLINTHNQPSTLETLRQEGFDSNLSKEGLIELQSQRAIDNPENIARVLIQHGHSLTKLTVEEEDLESYFLRATQAKGGN